MPSYEYQCSRCQKRASLRRLFAEMDDPAECLDCGAPLARQFTPNANLLIPLSFRNVLTGGQGDGGGQLSWSDFHDRSEKELARDPNVVRYNEAMSQPGAGVSKANRKDSPNARSSRDAFRKAASRTIAELRARESV